MDTLLIQDLVSGCAQEVRDAFPCPASQHSALSYSLPFPVRLQTSGRASEGRYKLLKRLKAEPSRQTCLRAV